MSNLLHGELSDAVIKAFYHVYNTLGHGFLPSVYANSLAVTLRKCPLQIASRVPVKVFFEGVQVGYFQADLIVNDKIVVMVTANETITNAATAQLVNYLRASPHEVGLLLNFGLSAEFTRKVFTNDRKPSLHLPPAKTNHPTKE